METTEQQHRQGVAAQCKPGQRIEEKPEERKDRDAWHSGEEGGGVEAARLTQLWKRCCQQLLSSQRLSKHRQQNRQAQELREVMNGEMELHEQGIMTRDNSHSRTGTGR